MDKIININNSFYQYIVIEGRIHGYKPYSGRLYKYFNVDKLLTDKQYYQKVSESGYIYFEKEFWIDNKIRQTFDISLTENFVVFFKLNWGKESFYEGLILLSKVISINNVESLYEFYLEIEINGIRTKFIQSLNDKNILYIDKPKDEKLEYEMNKILGEPQIPSDIGHDKYGSHYYYIVPTDKLDKIIGIKRYRDTSTFGKADGEKFTGKIEEIILDLHNFDENIYEIFKEHGMVEIKE